MYEAYHIHIYYFSLLGNRSTLSLETSSLFNVEAALAKQHFATIFNGLTLLLNRPLSPAFFAMSLEGDVLEQESDFAPAGEFTGQNIAAAIYAALTHVAPELDSHELLGSGEAHASGINSFWIAAVCASLPSDVNRLIAKLLRIGMEDDARFLPRVCGAVLQNAEEVQSRLSRWQRANLKIVSMGPEKFGIAIRGSEVVWIAQISESAKAKPYVYWLMEVANLDNVVGKLTRADFEVESLTESNQKTIIIPDEEINYGFSFYESGNPAAEHSDRLINIARSQLNLPTLKLLAF